MCRTILFLEDESGMRRYSVEWLKEKGYKVVDFRRIDLANQHLEKHLEEINCVITDLNMSDEWLGSHRIESDGCFLSGWVWLKYFVFSKRERMPTIIYSGYISYLKSYLESKDRLWELEQSNIVCVEKGASQVQGFIGLLYALEHKLHIRGGQP